MDGSVNCSAALFGDPMPRLGREVETFLGLRQWGLRKQDEVTRFGRGAFCSTCSMRLDWSMSVLPPSICFGCVAGFCWPISCSDAFLTIPACIDTLARVILTEGRNIRIHCCWRKKATRHECKPQIARLGNGTSVPYGCVLVLFFSSTC